MMPRLPHLLAALVLLAAGLGAPAAQAQIYTLPFADTTAGLDFGVAVDIDGDRAVVGASGEDVCGPNSGAAYVFERGDAGAWARTARLVAGNCRENGFFGRRVAISGSYVVVGSSSEFFAREEVNPAYVFERRPDSTWRPAASLLPDLRQRREGTFGADLDISDGRIAVSTAGQPDSLRHGAVYVYERAPSGTWPRVARLTTTGDPRKGVLGGDVSLDGPRLAVAASTGLRREPGSAYVFDRTPGGTWSRVAHLTGVEDFFISLALDGDRLVVGEARAGRKDTGAATVYAAQPDGGWGEETVLRSSTPYEEGAFGSGVAFDGRRALIVGYDEQLRQDFNIDRVVYFFSREDDGSWRQRYIIDIGEVDFGTAIALDGRTALVSAVPSGAPGAVYVVQLP
jgi:hypothetical protein